MAGAVSAEGAVVEEALTGEALAGGALTGEALTGGAGVVVEDVGIEGGTFWAL